MKKNALDQLTTLRRDHAKSASEQVAMTLRAVEEAAALRVAREQARADLEQQLRRQIQQENSQLNTGVLRAADLAQGALWNIHRSQLQQQAESAIQEAMQAVEQAQSSANQARAVLADARAQARVAEEAARRLHSREEAIQMARSEEENEDRHAARSSLRSRGR